jgi:peroxiredoxin
MIKVGDTLPSVTLHEYSEVEGNGCSIGPNPVDVAKAAAGKTIAVFALPGAFTPTCSAKHLPGFVDSAEALKAKGVDEIVCTAVNDAFVMGAWGKSAGADGKVSMLADGNGDFVKAIGLTMDATGAGLGLRGQRFSMIVKDGVITTLNVEEPREYKVSSAEHMLGQL